ncbi:uncharacterized protein LOC106529807 [Austrofundulus limnaeus]|uniref:Uncharacterized protein LOC106529807 n=1 Tax=Austrofundulus limnaeus TaxID=52670 RepID=A0A2I4CLA6_AUSLI|nr:PREDICTED: uncharacterized protein LOC106529807 [Austrofundulus limnaeus]
MGLCLRVAWICVLCITGNCFPVDYRDDNTTSFSSSGALEFSDLEYLDISPPGNESSLEATNGAAEPLPTLEPEDPNITSESTFTSSPVSAPRASPSGPSRNTEDKIPDASMQSKLVSGAGGFGAAPPSPWYGSQFYHEDMHAGSHPYSYESSTMGFPHHSYTGSPPYGSPYSTAFSPHYNYAYSSGGSLHHGYVAPAYPPFGYGTTKTTPPYGYFLQQHPLIDPELLLIGNLLMRIRQMPLAQAWRSSEESVGAIEEKYPFSHVVQSNSNSHRERDLRSNSQYSEKPSDHSPETEVLQKPSNVPLLTSRSKGSL